MQRRTNNIEVCIIASIFFLFGSCKQLEMFPHTEKGTETYCIYKVGAVKNTGTMRALKKGDVICLYCSSPFQCVLYTKQWIKVFSVEGSPVPGQLFTKKNTGISYYLETDDPSASCTSCPGINKFELLSN